MKVTGKSARAASKLLFALLLVIAQTGALAHAYQHDPGSPQQQVCSSCVTAGQLSSACVDNGSAPEPNVSHGRYDVPACRATESHDVATARQRGPPSPS